MFETLDTSVFATAETAYGPADGVLDELRELGGDDPDAAASALYSLHAGLFHQDQFDASTKLIVPFLLEVLTLDVPIRADIVRLLTRMLPHARIDSFVTHARGYVETPTEHALAAVAEIGRGRAVIETLLDAESESLRCAAAWLLAGLAPTNPAPLAARLSIETDDDVRVALHLALAAMGQPPTAEPTTDTFAEYIALVLAAQSPLDDDTAFIFRCLMSAPPWPGLDFENGLQAQVAARQLLRLGRDEPRAFELIRAGWEAQKALPALASPHDYIHVGQTREEYDLRRTTATFDTPGPVLDAMLVWAAFKHDAFNEPIVNYDTLDDRQRFVLENVRVSRASVAAQRARLRGDFILDEVVTIGERTASIEAHLVATGKSDDANDEIIAALVAQLSPARMFELAMTIMDADLSGFLFAAQLAVMRGATQCVTDERVRQWLATHEHVTYTQGQLALHSYRDVEPKREPPREFDRLVIVDLHSSRPNEKAWIATFPSPRREQLLVLIYPTFWKRVPGLYDPELLAELLLNAFLAPTCCWKDEAAVEALEGVPLELLLARCADVTGGRARVLAKIVKARQPRAHFTLTVTGSAGAFRLALARASGPNLVVLELPSITTTNALAPVVDVLRLHQRAIVTITGSVAPDDAYRLQLALGEHTSPIEIHGLDGTVLRAGL